MHYRSHTSRSNRARSAWLAWAALALLCAAGCQSNAERDLAARDRRLQEDQLYAMQDYISQYQQLVCRFRSENTSLRRQLAEDRGGAPTGREPQPMPRTPTTNNGPNIEIPPTPGSEKKRSPTPNLEMPDVPPLKQGASEHSSHVQAASFNESIPDSNAPHGEAASAAGSVAVKSAYDSAPSPDILLSGEVVANESGGGPRLVIDVEPFDRSGHMAQFNGQVSLMLVAANGDGQKRKLSRWDFGPDDVRSAVEAAASEQMMRFHVELPAGTPVDGATELWVRLVPNSGGKVLSHAKIDLTQPGVFSSRTDKIWPSEESVVAASYEEPIAKPDTVATSVNEGTWTTAQPGKPANLPPESDQAGGGWRASSEPIPALAANTTPTAPMYTGRPKSSESNSKNAVTANVAPRPAWTPDRLGNALRSPAPSGESHTATRPSWSATR